MNTGVVREVILCLAPVFIDFHQVDLKADSPGDALNYDQQRTQVRDGRFEPKVKKVNYEHARVIDDKVNQAGYTIMIESSMDNVHQCLQSNKAME